MARNDMNRPTMKISYNAPVALTFALLSLLALVANHFTGGWVNASLCSVYRCSLADPLAWFRFFGHVLGHSGYAHYISNMVLILVLGPNLEDRFGRHCPFGGLRHRIHDDPAVLLWRCAQRHHPHHTDLGGHLLPGW